MPAKRLIRGLAPAWGVPRATQDIDFAVAIGTRDPHACLSAFRLARNQGVPVVRWDMLVLLKLYAGGPQDVLDAQQNVKARPPSEEELHRISSLADRLGIREEWTALSAEHAKGH